jgi:hypothetical protein
MIIILFFILSAASEALQATKQANKSIHLPWLIKNIF